MTNNELINLAKKVDKILKEELKNNNIEYDMAEVRIYDIKTVGVQGDTRTYCYPAEITLYNKGEFVWQPEFLSRLSTRITNEVVNINKVIYLTATKKE